MSTWALATLSLNYIPSSQAWSYAQTENGSALISWSTGVTTVVHDATRVYLRVTNGYMRDPGFATIHGYVHEDQLAVRGLPTWARTHDPSFPYQGVAGLPLRCFRIAASGSPLGLWEPVPAPGSIEFRGALALGSPALAYGSRSNGILIPYAVRPLPFVVNVMLLTLAWAIVISLLANAWRFGHGMLRSRRGQCPACGYDLAGVQADVCPECGAPRAAL